MSEAYSIPSDAGLSIGLRFHNGHWYKWSNELNAFGMVDDAAAVIAIQRITEVVTALPFTLALSAALNAGQGGNHAAPH